MNSSLTHTMHVLHQACVLVRHKQAPLTWRLKCGGNQILDILNAFLFDVCVPTGLVYLYVANVLSVKNFDKLEEVDPMQMKESMDSMMSQMLLPVSFFMFCRKLLG